MNFFDAVVQHLRRVHVRYPAVRIERRPTHRRFFASRHPDRRMRLLNRMRVESDSGKFGEAPFEANVLFGPKLFDDLQRLIRSRAALLDRYAAGFEFFGKFAAYSDAQVISAVRSK